MKRFVFMVASSLILLATSCNSNSASYNKTIFIAPETMPCTAGVMETQCMQVKWAKDQQEWQNFFGKIEGFNFEEGFTYELIVREEKIENPPMDASSLKYILVKEVSKNR